MQCAVIGLQFKPYSIWFHYTLYLQNCPSQLTYTQQGPQCEMGCELLQVGVNKDSSPELAKLEAG